MITQELLGYIRIELSKGKMREEIRKALLSDGGWSEDDLSEAFRTAIPMQSPVASVIQPSIKPVIQPVIQPEKSPALSPILPTPVFSPPPSPSSSPLPSFSPPPLHSFSPPSSYSPLSSLLKPTPLSKPSFSSHSLFSLLKFLIILIIIGGLSFGFWYYRPQVNSQIMNLSSRATNLINSSSQPVVNLWTSLINGIKGFRLPFLNTNQTINKENTAVTNTVPQKTISEIKNCGIGVAPKLDTPSTYKNNPVLSCLGVSAVSCENAKGILKDDFFPTVFEITKSQNSCNFKLSYPTDSILADITGKQLAGQYILCPIDIVKAIDNTKPASPKFLVPSKTDLSKYASDVYFYGILGLFMENNLDPNRIQVLGCSGEYIQSVIASYRLMHAQ
jgi:hypothetical protein